MRKPLPGHPVRGSKTGKPIMALFDLLGRRWALGVIWQLSDGALTFRALQDRCDGVSPSVLNTRIKELSTAGLIMRGQDGYHLTTAGAQLFDLMRPLGAWSQDWADQLGSDPS
jgi:DNA-binding HxlR family transcriptional regulator